MSLIELVAVAV